ncbi:MAG: hypothetical protein AMJ95_02425 [Omnitrophica WOR_2 bacterium SM23_72]|nr:MAG: hypothetical protein AMJ95_02425 [Omnitrophica WOR_2 bacterium SM23_72]
MKMRKGVLFLLFVIMVQLGFNILPALSQTEKESREVKNFIKNFIEDFARFDLDSAFSKISTNYRGPSVGETPGLDYNTLKTLLINNVKEESKKYKKKHEIYNLDFLKLIVKRNHAIVGVAYRWKGFNFETKQEDSGFRIHRFVLVKENGNWKIIRWTQVAQ